MNALVTSVLASFGCRTLPLHFSRHLDEVVLTVHVLVLGAT